MTVLRSFFSDSVAPYVGAWIETDSHYVAKLLQNVAPYVGAWIETQRVEKSCASYMSHPTWVRGLKLSSLSIRMSSTPMSHPTWVRGLKLSPCSGLLLDLLSHPTWVRGLKLSEWRDAAKLP